MSRLSASQSRGHAHQRAAQGSPTCTLAALSGVPCVSNTLKRGTVVEIGGVAAEVKLTLTVEQSAIEGEPPKAGKAATFGGGSYRILSVGKTPGGSTYEFDLGDPNR